MEASKSSSGGELRRVRTTCDRCHCCCGVIVWIQDGRVVKLEGDRDFPVNQGMMCPKGLATVQFLYHPERLKYPMRRAGARGEGKWERIGWDEALEYAAAKFNEVRERWGPGAVTWSWGDAAWHCSWITKQAWLYAMGSPTHFHSDAHYCYHPVMIANGVTFGDFITSEVGLDYRNSRCIALWGGNPVASHPTRARDIMIGKKRGAKLIVIDPRMTEIASKADIFLQIRPATDDALALAWLHVIIEEGIYDREFVDRWCVGFDELKERVREYTPERVSEITWISVDDIVRSARTYALNKPATCHNRIGLQMTTNINQTLRAIALLVAITGNIDIPGGNLMGCSPPGFKGIPQLMTKDLRLPAEIEDRRIGAKEFPLLSSSKSLALSCAHPPSVIHAIITGEPYPVKAVWALNDLLLCLEGSRETQEALEKLEFLVGSDFFMTPTLAHADLILPPASFLERDEIEHLGYTNLVGLRQKVIEPLWETRNEREIDFEIIRRMGLDAGQPWNSNEELNDYMLQGMGKTFEDLKKEVVIPTPEVRYKKYEETGFDTPSGKVELYSSMLEELGYEPLPFYKENPETPLSAPELAKDYPLILITGSRHVVYFHSSNRNIPWLREIVPDPCLEIHPETAERLGIREGDWVWVEGPYGRGRVKMRADITEAVDPRVVHAFSHWWFPERKDDPLRGAFDSNINAILTNDPPYDPVSGATPLRGNLCKVYRVEEEAGGLRNPSPAI